MATRTNQKAKMRILETVPDVGNMEVGEFLYDSTNGKIVLRTITGLKEWTQD